MRIIRQLVRVRLSGSSYSDPLDLRSDGDGCGPGRQHADKFIGAVEHDVVTVVHGEHILAFVSCVIADWWKRRIAETGGQDVGDALSGRVASTRVSGC
jgi:hypothetical protein